MGKKKEVKVETPVVEVVVDVTKEPEYPKGTVISHLDKDPNDPRNK